MDFLIFLAWALLYITAMGATEFKQRRSLHSAAAALGVREIRPWWSSRLNVEVDGLQVLVVAGDALNEESLEMHVVGRFARLSLRLEPPSFFNDPTAPDIPVGDATFDSAVIVQGSEAAVLGALHAAARGVALRLIGRKVQVLIAGRRLSVICSKSTPTSAIPDLVRGMVALAKALPANESVPECLAHNALTDPVAGVRLRNLETLVSDFGESTVARECCRAALKDRNPWVRLQAARGLGVDGLDALAELAKRSTLNEAVASEALLDFVTHAPTDAAGQVCLAVLASGRGDTRRRAIEAVGRLRYAPAQDALIRVLEGSEATSSEAAAMALAGLEGEAVESALLTALRHPQPATRVASARALAEGGKVRAVAPLRAVVEARDSSGGLRRAAREAIARIQARLVGAEAGQVALAEVDPQRGSVSLVSGEAEEGRVSLVDPLVGDKSR
jgi:HEAT repeat protein